MELEKFGKFITELRQEKGLTQKELTKKSNPFRKRIRTNPTKGQYEIE